MRTEAAIVKLARRDGEIAPEGPLLVYPEDTAEDDTRIRYVESEPALLAFFGPGEAEVRFDAAWDSDTWRLFGRVGRGTPMRAREELPKVDPGQQQCTEG